MRSSEAAQSRLSHQLFRGHHFTTPESVVKHLAVLQAQDATAVMWSIGARLPGSTLQTVERAFSEGKLVRTWLMRGTLHVVAASDVRWMQKLTVPRLMKGSERRSRELNVTASDFEAAEKICAQALARGKQLSRPALYDALEQGGQSTQKDRGYHLISQLGLRGVLCSGARDGTSPTFALLEAPSPGKWNEETALANLARRYFTSHGPATVHDFAGWAGLTLTQCRTAIALCSEIIEEIDVDGIAHFQGPASPRSDWKANDLVLLPPFDEYLLGYKNRDAVLNPDHMPLIANTKNGQFYPTVLSEGRVIGTWSRELTAQGVHVTAKQFGKWTKAQAIEFEREADRYAAFLGRERA